MEVQVLWVWLKFEMWCWNVGVCVKVQLCDFFNFKVCGVKLLWVDWV